MKLKITYILVLLFVAQLGYSQDGIPVYSNYFADNGYLIHPSMAGAANYGKLRLTARQQWFDQDEAPNIQTISYNTRLSDRSGIGAIAFLDRNGYHSQSGLYITYAHHIPFSRRTDVDLNQLSFGLSAGIIRSRLDETQFDPNNFDPIIAGIIQSTAYYNIDAGVSYNFLDFSTHFTVKNLLFKNRGLNDENFESNNQRRYLIAASYGINRYGSLWLWEPSFLFQFQERTGEQAIDINFKAYRDVGDARIFGGISYRRSFDGAEFINGSDVKDQKLVLITPVIGGNYKKFMFAYMYSIQSGDINFGSGGLHQISLGYNLFDGNVKNWSQDMKYNGMLRPNTRF